MSARICKLPSPNTLAPSKQGPPATALKISWRREKKIFEEGEPDKNLPACSACHGANGTGSDTVPSLAGQMYAYTVAQLKAWGKGYRRKDPVSPENPNTMQPIAEGMTKEQIAAVSAYLSRLD